MPGVCTTRGFLRRVSLRVTASIVLAAAHSNAPDTSSDVPDPLEVPVSLTCPCSFPHVGIVSELTSQILLFGLSSFVNRELYNGDFRTGRFLLHEQAGRA